MKKAMGKFKDYFIPHEGNEHRPHALRPNAVAFIVVVALVAESAFVFGAKYIIPNSKLFGIVEANALIQETNQQRETNALPALQESPALDEAAQEKANDMATKGYFAHTSPQGLTPWYWFENVGYSFSYAGENLAVNFSDSQDVTNAWMNSPEHRANILSSDFMQIGMATAQGTFDGQPATYVVEEFGTPAATPIAFIDAAAAASVPTTEPMPVAPAATPASASASGTKTASAPKKSVPAVPAGTPVVPTIVAMQNSENSSSIQSFVAVKGASVSATQPSAPTTVPSAPTANASQPATESNFIQTLFSNPRSLANDFYYFLIFIFLVALTLNVFVNIRVQYPRLIMGGLLVIVVAGLCVMLNQNIGFLQATVL